MDLLWKNRKSGKRRKFKTKAGTNSRKTTVVKCNKEKQHPNHSKSGKELEQSIEIGAHGKPYFKDKTRFPFFNISHSGDYAVCAVATCEIGIDIQKIQSYSPRLLRRILTKQELLQLEQSEEKESFFCRLWSQKESYVKWSGQGITRELDTLEKNAWQESFLIEDYWVCVTAQSACKIECIKEAE